MRLSRAAAFLCVATILFSLAACERLSKLDAMPQRLSDLEGLSQISNTELAAMRGHLMDQESRILALEQAQFAKRSESQPPTREQVATLGNVVADCVKTARASVPAGLSELDGKFWTGFDAYYNPGSGSVENNVMYNGERPALYAFNKCMTAKGMPLGTSRK